MPKPGSEIEFADYGLTERQIALVKTYLKTTSSYKELANEYNISLSLVKHEMREVFSIFEVNNLKELHILLLQYNIKLD